MATEKNISSRIINKHDTEANWNKATNFIPKAGEIIIYDKDENYNYERIKIGDGKELVNNLLVLNHYLTIDEINEICQFSTNGKIMTVIIDLTNSDPSTCCSYADAAVDMTAGSSDWDKFFGHYPVLLKDGNEVVKLNPNNYAQDINGNAVDIESGASGDVMIAFPKLGLRINNIDDTQISISFSSIPNDEKMNYYAHQHNSNELSKFYVGAYNGYIDDDGKLRSLSGKAPSHTITIGEARTAA